LFHIVEPLLTQGFTSRVLALFYIALQDLRYLVGVNSLTQIQDWSTVIGRLTALQFNTVIDIVRERVFTYTT